MFSAEAFSSLPQQDLHCPRAAKAARYGREFKRLRKNLISLIKAQSKFIYLGMNWTVADLAMQHGFSDVDLANARIGTIHGEVTVIAVPSRHWHQSGSMDMLMTLKRAASDAGHRCVVLPETAIHKQPRLDNSLMLAQSGTVDVSATSRMNLIAYLIENGSCSLIECASVVEGSDPVASVLRLASMGVVQVDLEQTIGPHTLVHLPA